MRPYRFQTLLVDLDRCEHGRHSQDNCSSCPGQQSTGNLYLTPGQRIGTSLGGDPIVVPEDLNNWDIRHDANNWSRPR